MGLIERVSRGVSKLGLAPKVIAALPLLSLLAYITGILWLFVLPLEGQFRHTYVSENALLPHQASTHFRETEWHILRGYRTKIRDLYELPEVERNDALAALFRDMSLRTAAQNWTGTDSYDSGAAREGQNLYAILHAPRGSHNEAVVVVAPWLNVDGEVNDGGLALIVSLARYFRRWSVWHKNIIFVVPSNSGVALRKWVEAYHTSLKYTAGSIEGALVLDYPDMGENFDHIEISYDGINGEQPNLDLLNAVVRIGDAEGVKSEILGMGPSYSLYGQRLEAEFRGIARQMFAGIVPGPGSEMFSGWRIDAVTIRARGEGNHDITTFGRVAESTVRSINNLMEHFHQSFFFYLLMGPRYFVSIGTYLPAAMLVANSFPIMAVSSLIPLGPIDSATVVQSLGMVSTIWIVPTLANYLLEPVLSSAFVQVTGFVALVVLVLSLAPMLPARGKVVLHAVSLIIYGLGLTVLATLNFSQAFALGVIAYPLVWVRPQNKLDPVLLAASCPLVGMICMARYFGCSVAELAFKLVNARIELNIWAWSMIISLWLPLWLSTVLVACPSARKLKAQ